MKKFLTCFLVFLTVAAMLLPLASCKKDGDGPDTTTGTSGDPNQPGAGYVDDGKTYSYRLAPADLPSSWNLHTYQSNTSTYVLDYSTDTLYRFEYNDDFTGYEIVPSMAKDFPVDVTSEYVGQYGISEGEENKAYKIVLRDNLKFDNGEVLNAHSFVESMKLLLNPDAANFRADNVYQAGQLKIYNAENYVKQGKYSLSEFVSAAYGADEYVDPADFTQTADGYYQYNGKDIVVDLNSGGNWGDSLALYAENKLISADLYKILDDAADDNGWVKLNAITLKAVQDCIAELHGYENVEAYAAAEGDYAYQEFEEMAFFGSQYAEMAYEGNVGFFATADNELVIILKNAMEDNFYLRYELCTHFFLVYAPLYESLIDMSSGVYANTYGTSVDTYVGYGPYKLTSYVDGTQIVLERNLNWHGYSAEEYVPGTYMTDRVVYNCVKLDSTRLEMFLKGEIDSYGLTAEDMQDYMGSDYTYFTDSESTWYLAMNPGYENLEKIQATLSPKTPGNTVNKTVLTIPEFRQALSYSLDRTEFIQALSPTSGVAKALLSAMIVADPESGLTYRAMDEAKDAILEFWGLSDHWGPGKEYETRDDAIDSITGYDPAGAKALFQQAYDIAVKNGYLSEDGKWEIHIVIGKPADADFYTKGFEFLSACWTEAVKGTPFEDKLVFEISQTLGGTTFGDYLKNGSVDILFGVGYSGSQFDPYSMMDCFTGNLQYDTFTDKAEVDLDIEIDGKILRASLYDWVSRALQGDTIEAIVVDQNGEATGEKVSLSAGSNDDSALRVKILAKAEAKILTLSNIFPLMTDASAQLRCMRIAYKTEDYVVGMGFGGIEWYTYAMDDAEFAAYVSSQDGGVLNYK